MHRMGVRVYYVCARDQIGDGPTCSGRGHYTVGGRRHADVGGQYSQQTRQIATGDDELGALLKIFEGLLEQIQHQDKVMQAYNEELEMQVDKRTKELQRHLQMPHPHHLKLHPVQ